MSAARDSGWRLPDGWDRRLTPARADLADSALEGRIAAGRYVSPVARQVVAPLANLHPEPDAATRIDTQLLLGEPVDLYDEADGWAWVRSRTDGYVGYLRAVCLGGLADPTHRVATRAALSFAAADIKAPATRLPWPAAVRVLETVAGVGTHGLLGHIAGGGFVPMAHLAPAETRAADWVAEAEALLGQPYLWGGRSGDGMDCSSLLQLALATAGCAFPRDSDMQAGADLPGVTRLDAESLAALRRGDLVFWAGHVGVMQNGERLLHANAHHMAVASEPLAETVARIAAKEGKGVTAVLRLDTSLMQQRLTLEPPLAERTVGKPSS
ncbi:MAG: NlpC/P60 family protein [Pseudomonadota bacterium]